MSTYLITGGAGFVGSHLAEMCLRFGHRVICLDNCHSGAVRNVHAWRDHSHFEFVQDEVSNRATLRPCLGRADVVVHLAAERVVKTNAEWRSSLASNYDATCALLEEAASSGTNVVLVSSEDIYRSTKEHPRNTNSALGVASPDAPHWGQSVSNLVDECLARDLETPTTVARLFTTIGPRQNHQYGALVLQLFGQAFAGKTLTVPGTGQRKSNYSYISDIVHWLLLLSQSEESIGNVYDLGNPWMISDVDLARKVSRITDACVEIEFAEDPNETCDYQEVRPDISKIQALTGFKPRVDVDEALRRIHTWLLATLPT